MKNIKTILPVLGVSCLLVLTGCGEKSLKGDYVYKGWNGLANMAEDWKLVVADDSTYVLSLTNDFLQSENYGNVIKNEDETYTLVHTGSKDPAYPYPAIIWGFAAVDEAKTDWRCVGNFDFEAMTFTPSATK